MSSCAGPTPTPPLAPGERSVNRRYGMERRLVCFPTRLWWGWLIGILWGGGDAPCRDLRTSPRKSLSYNLFRFKVGKSAKKILTKKVFFNVLKKVLSFPIKLLLPPPFLAEMFPNKMVASPVSFHLFPFLTKCITLLP